MIPTEHTGQRDLLFSQWIREFLPHVSFGATDIDFYLLNYKTKKFMLLEIKCRMADPKEWQRDALLMINHLLKLGMTQTTSFSDWKYLGAHLIQFETEPYGEGRIYLDREEIKESELIERLSMNNLPEEE